MKYITDHPVLLGIAGHQEERPMPKTDAQARPRVPPRLHLEGPGAAEGKGYNIRVSETLKDIIDSKILINLSRSNNWTLTKQHL